MRTVTVTRSFPGTVHDAETCWYDVRTWPSWVDGMARVDDVAGDWPRPGAVVRWESGPAGRGHVTEKVVAHEPLRGQTVEVTDDSIWGRQQVSFTPAGDEVAVSVSLEYQVTKRTVFTPVVDLLFIRSAMERSLRSTLARFGAELAATRQSNVG
jgi:hypothetical protein